MFVVWQGAQWPRVGVPSANCNFDCLDGMMFVVWQGAGAAVPDVVHVVHRTWHDPGLGGGHDREPRDR